MKLVQLFSKPICGGAGLVERSRYEWEIEHRYIGRDFKVVLVRVGSWEANAWFHVAQGKTDKLTLANARRRLAASSKRLGVPCTFSYED